MTELLLGACVTLTVIAASLSFLRPWTAIISIAVSGAILILDNPFSGSKSFLISPVAAAVGFLIVAVPLGVLLEKLGFFAALADKIPPKASLPLLWVLAALVTTVMNLDASIVLLTPLYFEYSKRLRVPPIALVFQPLILSLLASSALPVSNLTNLVFSGVLHASPGTFIRHLALPSLVSISLGYFLWKRGFAEELSRESAGEINSGGVTASAIDTKENPLRVGGICTVTLLAGFLGGPYLGIAPWEVVLFVDVILMAVTRSVSLRWLPVVPAVVVSGVAIAALALAEKITVEHRFSTGVFQVVVFSLVGAVVASVINNIPAVAGALVILHHQPQQLLWGVLLGTNMGPSTLFIGTLASILWLSIVQRLGVAVSAAKFFQVACKVSIPCFIAGLIVLVLVG